MITTILAGYSPRNKDWADGLAKDLKLDHKVIVHNWKHWSGGSFSMPYELKKLTEEIGDEGQINLIAKSVGTRVVMNLPDEIVKRVNKLILCGIPTKLENNAARKLYKDGLNKFDPKKITIFQNEKDPLANYLVINKFVKSVNKNIEVKSMPRSDHHYPYTSEFRKFLV